MTRDRTIFNRRGAAAALTARRVPPIGDPGSNSFKVTATEWRVPSRFVPANLPASV
jgi:hypothetical protein